MRSLFIFTMSFFILSISALKADELSEQTSFDFALPKNLNQMMAPFVIANNHESIDTGSSIFQFDCENIFCALSNKKFDIQHLLVNFQGILPKENDFEALFLENFSRDLSQSGFGFTLDQGNQLDLNISLSF